MTSQTYSSALICECLSLTSKTWELKYHTEASAGISDCFLFKANAYVKPALKMKTLFFENGRFRLVKLLLSNCE